MMTVNAATMEGHIRDQVFDCSSKSRVSLMTRIFGCWHLHMGWPTFLESVAKNHQKLRANTIEHYWDVTRLIARPLNVQ